MDEFQVIEDLKSSNTRVVFASLDKLRNMLYTPTSQFISNDLVYQALTPLIVHPHYKIRSLACTNMLILLEKYIDSIQNIEFGLQNIASSLLSVNRQVSASSLQAIKIIINKIEPKRYWSTIKNIILNGKSLQVREFILEILIDFANVIPLSPIFLLLDDPKSQIREAALKILKNADQDKLINTYNKVIISYDATQLLNKNINFNNSKLSRDLSQSISCIKPVSVSITQDSLSLLKSNNSSLAPEIKNSKEIFSLLIPNFESSQKENEISSLQSIQENSTSHISASDVKSCSSVSNPKSKSKASVKSDKLTQTSSVFKQKENIERETSKKSQSKGDYGYYSHYYYSDYPYSYYSEKNQKDKKVTKTQDDSPLYQAVSDEKSIPTSNKPIKTQKSQNEKIPKNKSSSVNDLKDSPVSKASSKFQSDVNSKKQNSLKKTQQKRPQIKSEKVIEDYDHESSISNQNDSLFKSDLSPKSTNTSLKVHRNPESAFSDSKIRFSFSNQKNYSSINSERNHPLAKIPKHIIMRASWLEKLTYLEQISHAITENAPFDPNNVVEAILASCETFHIRVAQFAPGLLHDIILRYPEILKTYLKGIILLMLNLSNLPESDSLFDALVVETKREDLVSSALDVGESTPKTLPVEQFCLAVLNSPTASGYLSLTTVKRLITKICDRKNEFLSISLAKVLCKNYTKFVQIAACEQGIEVKRFLAPFVREVLKMKNQLEKQKNANSIDYSPIIETFNTADEPEKMALFRKFLNDINSMTEETFSYQEKMISDISQSIRDPKLLEIVFSDKNGGKTNLIFPLSRIIPYCNEELLVGADRYYQTLYKMFKSGNSSLRNEIVKLICMIENTVGKSILDEPNIPETHRILIGEMMSQYL